MTSEERRAWLDGLKEGDWVIVDCPRDGWSQERTIQAAYEKEVVVATRYFDRENGKHDFMGGLTIYPLSQKANREMLDQLRKKVQSTNLPIATVRKLLAVLAEAEGEEKASDAETNKA